MLLLILLLGLVGEDHEPGAGAVGGERGTKCREQVYKNYFHRVNTEIVFFKMIGSHWQSRLWTKMNSFFCFFRDSRILLIPMAGFPHGQNTLDKTPSRSL